jgi:hypothetical protein
MTGRIALCFSSLLTLVLATGTAVLAHEGHDHKVLGTVTMAAADHVMLKDKAGKDVTIQITGDTKVLKDNKPVTPADIKAGMRVVVTAASVTEKGSEKMTAKTIMLGGGAPATK